MAFAERFCSRLMKMSLNRQEQCEGRERRVGV